MADDMTGFLSDLLPMSTPVAVGIVVLVLLVLVALYLIYRSVKQSEKEETITVQSKDKQLNMSNNRSHYTYYVTSTAGTTYNLSPLSTGRTPMDMYNAVQTGKTYKAKTYGSAIGFLGVHKAIDSMDPA